MEEQNKHELGFLAIRKISLFEKFTDEELRTLYELGEFKDFDSQINIVIEGEKTRGLYIVLSGRVSIYKNDHITKSMIRLAYLEQGDVFGELSLFDDTTRSATVTSEIPSEMFYLDITKFNSFLDSEQDDLKVRFYKKCAEEMAERFRLQNNDFILAQNLLWKYGLRKNIDNKEEEKEKEKEENNVEN